MSSDSIHESCGVFGVFNNPQAAHLVYLGLYALQHRGQESSGIAVFDGNTVNIHKGMGLVGHVFQHQSTIEKLTGHSAIGHNRYSTTGASTIENAQPILINCRAGLIAGAHNGNLINADSLRKRMVNDGSIFMSTTDTEVIMHLIARSKRETTEAMILDALSGIDGAYSVVFLAGETLYGARDPRGMRPLILGKNSEGNFFLSSETCAFDLTGAQMIREIKPGEMVKIDKKGIVSYRIPVFEPEIKPAHCIFEFIYFSRPDSFVFGSNVDKIRRKFGQQLAIDFPVKDADLVMGVPDSATTAALGFSEQSGIRFDIGLIRNHYVGRTFIHPGQSSRDFGTKIKFNPVKGVLKDKKVIIVDDSIVRGTTMKKIINLVKMAEPAQIHLRISSPPILYPCFYGIDMPTESELIASTRSVEEIRAYLEVDSLEFLSVKGMLSVLPEPQNFCTACFNGKYPVLEKKKAMEKAMVQL